MTRANLGSSVADAMLQRRPEQMPLSQDFVGAGIYAIYYVGGFKLYSPISRRNQKQQFQWPLYIGRAVPQGARKGNVQAGDYRGKVLFNRLREHARSIEEVDNLDIRHFYCRYLTVDDIWIPLGETLLIGKFSPLWNRCLDGFGNHDPGKGRYGQERSPWDTLHSGRDWAARCARNKRGVKDIASEVSAFLAKVEERRS